MADHTSLTAADLALLSWYQEMGVDAVLDEDPHDRYAEARAAAPTAAPADEPRRPARPGAPAAPSRTAAPAIVPAAVDTVDAVAAQARSLAASARSLDDLKALLAQFDGCALRNTAKNLVFGDGNPAGGLMLVGEAPGEEEDRQGVPFIGRSGQLLDRMLAAIGLDRSQVYIANLIPWRPPGNRTPTPQEWAACQPFIQRQIALVDPAVLVCLGAPSSQALLGAKEGIGKFRGRWVTYDTGRRAIPALATYHPAYLLRVPVNKSYVWRDLKAIKARLTAEQSARGPV